jgi:hypothetical protein
MKRIIETTEDSGLESMLGESVLLICGSYFYAGEVVGVNGDHVELRSAQIVYETGPWTSAGWKDAQPLPGDVWRVQMASIESWGVGK